MMDPLFRRLFNLPKLVQYNLIWKRLKPMHLGFERLETVLEFWALILASELLKPKLSLMLPLTELWI